MKNLILLLAISILIISCSEDEKSELTVHTKLLRLNYQETKTIEAVSDYPITCSCPDPYHATSQMLNVTANKVGVTVVDVESNDRKESVRIEIVPVYNLYDMPEVDWSKGLTEIINEQGQPQTKDLHTISYSLSEGVAYKKAYVFEEDNAQLAASVILIGKEHYRDVKAALLERYEYQGMLYFSDSDANEELYFDALQEEDATMFVVLNEWTNGDLIVYYVPRTRDLPPKINEINQKLENF
ncbi:hypothetical protein [Carboxylicivirga taeanensis]|uniref:hypothetical protein n=1 Tax=Carboxylicivirga taeanensis TaxID=1416875 RepID=UPI003F6DFEA8